MRVANLKDDITGLLARAGAGDARAADELLPLVYGKLRALAAELMKQERSDHTLQPTALVHEAYLKLVDQTQARWEDRAHFFSVAAQAIRRVLVDHARSRARAKRGGKWSRLQFDGGMVATYDRTIDVLALDDALSRPAEQDAQRARVVELRFFGGLKCEEAAAVLQTSPRSVERQWRYARAWLYRELAGDSA
ncbi:MAG: RNA polymerase subunit sigma-70 [Phycisphaerales bacterium]|nr:RNA polymerase subunit sigma-70 [Phycisphaerales bacterium]MCB9858656.1 RNA polymerase subunit sigma-70 [Phycisphaerales bacterium]